ncbi:methyltransferase domain-containing protein [Shewanella sp. GXUN23E]|uniref:methyltransferase domain-containing protein n=1 Tax=Shewanella sp. GXUN23E TaxID=3422498 RepID=UPI003D7E72F5
MRHEVSLPLGDNIAHQFSRAAERYREHNHLQRQTAQLLQSGFTPRGTLLDIGAGPGTEFISPGQVIALDIAPAMLRTLKATFPQQFAICADAQALPLVSASIDCLYSNLALQWCPQLELALAEIHRVLKPGGRCRLALVVDGSLPELPILGLHRNAFPDAEVIRGQISGLPWQAMTLQEQTLKLHFDSLKSLLFSLKGVGATARFSQPRSTIEIKGKKEQSVDTDSHHFGLRGRAFWQQLGLRAESLREQPGLPLSYQILFVDAVK